MPENLLFIPLTHLAIERVVCKELSPNTRSNRAIKEIRIVRSAVPKQMAKLCLPARPGHVRHDPAPIMQVRERGRRVERGVHRRARVVRLVEHCEQDLPVRVDVPTRVLVVVAVRHRVGVICRGGTLGRRAKEREDARGGEKVFHQDGGKFDKVCRAARAGHILVLGAADHG